MGSEVVVCCSFVYYRITYPITIYSISQKELRNWRQLQLETLSQYPSNTRIVGFTSTNFRKTCSVH